MHTRPGALRPQILSVFQEGYSFPRFLQDLTAGIIVGVVALPLAIAFGIASGVKPEQGLYTAIVAGFLISLLSGSRVQIGGPTGAFVVIVADIVARHGVEGLALATMMAGVLLILLGVARFGVVIQYIPYPVTVGFTAGIAVIIAVGQLRDFLGLDMTSVPADFLPRLAACADHLGTVNPYAVLIGVLTMAVLLGWPRILPRVPGSLVAVVVATALVHLLDLPVETIGSRFGEVPTTLPAPRLPTVSWEAVRTLASPALTIALLAGIESLLSAVVADGMTGHRHRPNMELVAQGVANIASPIFGGIPATGAIARTATNVKSGGRTPIAGLAHAATLLLILLFFGSWAELIPMASLAGILIVVAYNMSEWRLVRRMFSSPRSDVLVLVVTLGLTVLIDLTVAIEVGIVLAAFLFMRRMVDVTQVKPLGRPAAGEEDDDGRATPLMPRRLLEVPDGVELFEAHGPFFFGAMEKFKTALARIERKPRALILRMRHVPVMDATGLQALEEVVGRTLRAGTVVFLTGVQEQPLAVMRRAGFVTRLGEERFCPDIHVALERTRALLEPQPAPAEPPAPPGQDAAP